MFFGHQLERGAVHVVVGHLRPTDRNFRQRGLEAPPPVLFFDLPRVFVDPFFSSAILIAVVEIVHAHAVVFHALFPFLAVVKQTAPQTLVGALLRGSFVRGARIR